MKPKSFPPTSMWATLASVCALFSLFLTSGSPFAALFILLVVLPHLVPNRFPRDSSTLWGVRLVSYALILFLGQGQSGPEFYRYWQSFITAGLIFGAEMVIEAWREPPPGARFHGVLIVVAGLVWVVSFNLRFRDEGLHLWALSPLFLMCLLFAMRDLRPHAAQKHPRTTLRQILAIGVAAGLGFVLHFTMWRFRGDIMTAGARLLANRVAFRSAGVTDVPSLQSSFDQGQDASRIMRIEGPLTDPHLRGAAFDEYFKGSWGPSVSSRSVVPANDADLKMEAEGKHIKLTLLSDSNGILFAPLNAQSLIYAEGSSFDWSRYAGPFKTEDPVPYTYQYIEGTTLGSDADELPSMTQGPLCVAPTNAQRGLLLQISPEISPKVRQLAHALTLKALTQPEKALKIVEFLAKNNHYSLNFEKGKGDPISSFILEKRSGHCQYFASSAAVLLRCVGIPARYVTGYYAHESAGPNLTVVRSRDAHAWCEAYFNGIGWVTVEATPPAGRADPTIAPVTPIQRFTEWFQDAFARFRAFLAGLTRPQLASIFAVILLLWLGERWRVSRKTRVAREEIRRNDHQLAPLAQRFERVLARRNLVLPPGTPWSEILAREEAAQWQAARGWVENYNRARFSDASDDLVRDLELQLANLEGKTGKSA